MVVLNNDNVGIAFALTIGAGLSTAVGASIVFFPKLVQYANRTTLASALGFSAGVMTYVSFIEIFRKSVQSFELAEYSSNRAYKIATLCFFGGVCLMLMINAAVTCLLNGHHHHHDHHDHQDDQDDQEDQNQTQLQESGDDGMEGVVIAVESRKANTVDTSTDESVIEFSPCHTCSENPVKDLQRIQTMANEIEEKQMSHEQTRVPKQGTEVDEEKNNGKNPEGTANAEVEAAVNDEKERKRLALTGINTAIAIGLHNFPEGLATFITVLNDPKVGFVLAIAIAIHNIPEGICVALPVYYASGSRRKAFLLALLSGISEPIAALFAYFILASMISDATFGVLYGIVSGMMIIICTRELIPTAHRYDPEDSYVTTSYIIGMAVMALALVLFLV